MDGTDFRIQEPKPFDKKYYSHKFHGPGLRYEVGLSIRTGEIVWANGGVPCGDWPDLRLARNAYTSMVGKNEMTVADKGYNDSIFFLFPKQNDPAAKRKHKIMARHETVNRRIKQFRVMGEKFRHSLFLHPRCFHAVINLIEIAIENGENLYSID